MVVLGTIGGHLLGTILLEAQALYCSVGPCISVGFDPNAYRVLLQGVSAARHAPDSAFVTWLFQALLLGPITGAVAFWLSRRALVNSILDPIAFGWLAPAVRAVKMGNSFVTAYVVTKMSHGELSVAYEGVVQQLALDDDQSIKLVVLNDVDRFLVRITDGGLERINSSANPITQLQITASEIANVALEVVQAPEQDVAAVDAEEATTEQQASDVGISGKDAPA